MGDLIAWAAPILSTIIITAATASINAQAKKHERVAEERHQETEKKRKAEAEWRVDVDRLMQEQGEALKSVANDRDDWYTWRAEMIARMQAQDNRIDTILQAQCTQMRSDIIHKCHRYLDDLGRASTEEKEALNAEHENYTAMCAANDIVNNFVDKLVERVMQLPEREI
jgi:hypothetical protein